MKKTIAQEIEEELERARRGESIVELDEDRSAKHTERRAGSVKITVSVTKRTYERLSKEAKKKKLPVAKVIEQLVNKGS